MFIVKESSSHHGNKMPQRKKSSSLLYELVKLIDTSDEMVDAGDVEDLWWGLPLN